MREKSEDIFKELKRRFNLLERDYGYEVVFIALQGSQNYGLDLYTDEYKSDLDCMAVVLPKFEDFVGNKQAISTTIVLDNNEHINIKDIRLYFELLYKQNVQFLELLFTDYKIVKKKYKDLVKPIFDRAESIANYDKVRLLSGISGMAKEKLNALEHPYPSIIDKIEKYGYDGKQLSHILRLNQFIDNIISGKTFKQSLTYFDSEEFKQMCIDAKLNKYDLEYARELAENYSNAIHEKKEKYFAENVFTTNYDVVDLLDAVKLDIFKAYYTEQLKPEIPEEFKFYPDQYPKVWVTADTHFGHKNILEYENRYERLNVSTIDEHDQELVRRWNEKVGEKDLVIILGDFAFKGAKQAENILKQLKGDKVLVEGNHDTFLYDKSFDRKLFKGIYKYAEVKYKGQEIALMHYPIQNFKHMNKEVKPAIQIFGHIHSFRVNIPKHSFNAGVDVNNYYPVNLEDAILKALVNNAGKINGIEIERGRYNGEGRRNKYDNI